MIDEGKTFERVLEKILTARPPEQAAKALVEAQLFLERRKARSKVIETLERILQQPGDRIQSLRDSGLIEPGDKKFQFDYPLPDEQEHLIRHQLEHLKAWNEGIAVAGSTEAPPYQGTRHLEPYKDLLRENRSCYPDSPTYFSSALRLVDEGLRTGPNHSWFGFDSQSGYEQFLENHLPRVELNTFKFWQAMREGYDMTPIFFKDEHGQVWSGMKEPVKKEFSEVLPWWHNGPFSEGVALCNQPSAALASTLISLKLTNKAPEWFKDRVPSNMPLPFDSTLFEDFKTVCALDEGTPKKGIPPCRIRTRVKDVVTSTNRAQAFLRGGEVCFHDSGPIRLLNTVDSLISWQSKILNEGKFDSQYGTYPISAAGIRIINQRMKLLLEMKQKLSHPCYIAGIEIAAISQRYLMEVSE